MATPPPGRFDARGLEQARQAAGLSRLELAERIGTDTDVIRLWEEGGARPGVKNLLRIANSLGLEIRDLYQPEVSTDGTLQDLRVSAGLSQRDLARKLGTTQTAVSRWERAVALPTWAEITAYSEALDVPRTVIAGAIDVTVETCARTPKRKTPKPSDFDVSGSSAHVIYDYEDPKGLVTLTSPQFPRFEFRCKTSNPSVLEVATINEHVEANYTHRYNHMQRRCGGETDNEPAYLIRWLDWLHESNEASQSRRFRTAADLIISTPLWRKGLIQGPTMALPSGEYLTVVVEAEDTLEFIRRQVNKYEPVALYPTFSIEDPKHVGGMVKPTATVRFVDDGMEPTDGWFGGFQGSELSDGMTYREIVEKIVDKHDGWPQIIAENASELPEEGTRMYENFGKKTPFEGNSRR
ncbi:helix-turn-helix transcriptional regulator [Mycobacteroides abscessus]|uniref:helix-turn-helix domain-containing protein n=1 Tax=Mycobacteroides abscessus TaxID=36809 RepID=UPI0009D5CB67|nr:helix-turn-helix transcriptional regulator [Mycobacteroides abscessus]MDM2645608.1 helix-turn-helix transcriptional regulator [Mycobacteroides abscessus]MDM2656029.1 helix-turn-helix transcriptional regulator [Mycobacteroides abscessus]MDM2664258.1 helix-turn-helix transcriptional regulator [Mycobacteroides abscessus]MDM2668624.1 helix-turn-helix transcriptional regulator [Mycobacteroides abscessus]MDM2672478.1 helix-turn-helix transcriptional regulator [Mycobacteroides abscessus]